MVLRPKEVRIKGFRPVESELELISVFKVASHQKLYLPQGGVYDHLTSLA